MVSTQTEDKDMKVSRRSFLGGAGGVLSLPWLVPASALGRDGTVAPSNRMLSRTPREGWEII